MSEPKLRVAVLGLGMMGNTHLDVYSRRPDVEVIAMADANPDRLSGKVRAGGNIEGQASGDHLFPEARRYAEAAELIDAEEADIIDICLPTPLHQRYALQALERGRHVLVEKPLCRSAAEAAALAEASEARPKQFLMPAMCIRFWPGWDTLKQAIDDRRYGTLRALSIQRLATHPGGAFYLDAEACGGALLDLHVHDTDFVAWCLGRPDSVSSTGYRQVTGGWDHVSTQYFYPDGALVTAEGGWAMAPGFPFTMRYQANFEEATLSYQLGAERPLTIYHASGESEQPELSPEMGYYFEIGYFLDCVRQGRPPRRVTARDGVQTMELYEAERAALEARG